MYFGLRPELRGAQRVLRSFIATKRQHQSARITTVRSFSCHLRLQKDANQPDTPETDDSSRKKQQAVQNAIDPQLIHQLWRKSIERENAIDRGEVPAGHSIAKTPADLPKELEHVDTNGITFPAFYINGPGYEGLTPIRRIPNNFPGYEGLKPVTTEIPGTHATVHAPVQTKPAEISSNSQSEESVSQNESARSVRRRRSRRSRPTPEEDDLEVEETEALPSWFAHGNIRIKPETGVSQTITDDDHSTRTFQGSEEAEKRDSTCESAESMECVERSASTEPSDNAGSNSTTPVQAEDILPLADGRYYIHRHQYAELLAILEGLVQRPSEAAAVQHSTSMRHLALFHAAKDSDLLLDALVKHLCVKIDAAHVKVDAQDIADFVLAAEPKPDILAVANKMSYDIYSNIYTNPEHEDFESEARDEEEDDEDEDGEHDNDETTDFSTVVALPVSITALPQSMAHFTTNMNDPNTMMRKLSSMLSGAMPSERAFKSQRPLEKIMDAYANAVVDTALKMVNKAATDAKEPGQASSQTPRPRPVIIQLPTYWQLRDHAGYRDFRHSLIVAADKRSEEGHPVVVVGTDVLRDLSFIYDNEGQSNQANRFLIEQKFKSGSATTAMMLTPCLPDKQAEAVLVQDRKNRIRDINARHLYRALKRRGFSLKDLEDGFWTSDYTEKLGEEDCKALPMGFLSYLVVERLSSMIVGLPESQNPVTDAIKIISESDQSKVAWAQELISTANTSDPAFSETPNRSRSDVIQRVRSNANKHEQKLMTGVVEPKKINTTFQDIHIPTDTVDALQTLTSLSLEYPEAFKYGVLKSDRIPGLMLYGPPGTGKTLAARAVAKESGATMLEVSAADLYDMYVGEGEKNIRALFSLAKKLSPCVVFIDEADALFSKRQERSTKSNHRELLNQFLKEWDGMSNDSGSAFIMVATNRPMDMDDAVLRRLPRRLLVDLPTEADRLEILKIHLRNETLSEEVSLAELAKKTPFYSGSDLKNLAVAAALQVVREQHAQAKLWQKKNQDSKERYKYPTTRTITQRHLDKALLEISASISEDMSSLKEIKKFDEQYGDRKARKKSPKWGFKSAAETDKVLDTVKVRS